MPIGELAMHYALKNHILQLQYNWIILKPKIVQKKTKYKAQAIPLKFWYRILVPDFPSWSRQIQIDLPYPSRTWQTANKMFISSLVWLQRNMSCTMELARAGWTRAGLWPVPHVAFGLCDMWPLAKWQRARYQVNSILYPFRWYPLFPWLSYNI